MTHHAPEFILSIAIGNYLSARDASDDLQSYYVAGRRKEKTRTKQKS